MSVDTQDADDEDDTLVDNLEWLAENSDGRKAEMARRLLDGLKGGS